MASDLETNPNFFHKLRASSQKNREKIFVATRWRDKNGFQDYNFLKLCLNKIFQVLFSILFRTKLSDLTFGYRIYPSNIIKKIKLDKKENHIIPF